MRDGAAILLNEVSHACTVKACPGACYVHGAPGQSPRDARTQSHLHTGRGQVIIQQNIVCIPFELVIKITLLHPYAYLIIITKTTFLVLNYGHNARLIY